MKYGDFLEVHNCYNTFLPFLPTESKPKPVKKKKRASRLSALEMLEEKSERKAKIKGQELDTTDYNKGNLNFRNRTKQQKERQNYN